MSEVKANPPSETVTAVAASRKDPHEAAKNQKVVTPEYMFLEAPRTKEFITGSEAAKEAIRRSNVDLAIAYPITPQSETMQLVGVLYGEGYVKEYYRGEEEVGVMAAIAGGSIEPKVLANFDLSASNEGTTRAVSNTSEASTGSQL